MAIGGLTRQTLESEGVQLAKELSRMFHLVDDLRDRLAAELAAGTLDGTDFYPPADPVAQADKANLLGFCDNMHDVWATKGDYIKALLV